MHIKIINAVSSTRVLLVAVALMASLGPTRAEAGLRVQGVRFEAVVAPGQTVVHRMTVSLNESSPPMDLGVQVKDFGTLSAKDFISIDKSTFHLEPNQSQDVAATMRVPADAGSGGRYATINISQLAGSESGVSILVAVDIPVLLTIKDSQLTQTGRITELEVSDPGSGQPISVTTHLENTGNHHYKARTAIVISDSSGRPVAGVQTQLTTSNLIPSVPNEIAASVKPDVVLPAGTYVVESTLMLDDGTVLDSATVNVELVEAFLPDSAPTAAPPAVSPTFAAASPIAVVSTDQGGNTNRIAISGAAAGAVLLALGMYLFGVRRGRGH